MSNEATKNKNSADRNVKFDIAAAIVLPVCLIICYFFWGCSLDLPVTIIAVIITVLGAVVLQRQNKKIKKLNAELEKN